MSAAMAEVFNLAQVYTRIGEQHEQMRAALHLPLLDPSASLDEDTTFRLALVTAFQYAENLPDPAAADASANRKDWRYALHLPDKHPGVAGPSLCKFRASLYFSTQAAREFEQLLGSLQKTGLFPIQAEAWDAEKLISRVCGITHFTHLKRSMKTALSCLVAADPDWLSANALPHWYERYRTGRLDLPVKLSTLDMQKEAVRLGRDIHYLLTTLNEQGMTQLISQAEIQDLAQVLESAFIVSGTQISWQPPMRTNCRCFGLGFSRTQFSP